MKDKVALITGASRGIGREIAIALAEREMEVAIHYNRGRSEAEATLAQIRDFGGRGHCFAADLSVHATIEPLFQQVEERFGRLDVLVNNAGMMRNTAISKVSESEFDAVFDLNVKAVFFCCQQAARRLADGGRIINIGTTVTKMMLADYGTYAASKGAVEQLTRVLARELETQYAEEYWRQYPEVEGDPIWGRESALGILGPRDHFRYRGRLQGKRWPVLKQE